MGVRWPCPALFPRSGRGQVWRRFRALSPRRPWRSGRSYVLAVVETFAPYKEVAKSAGQPPLEPSSQPSCAFPCHSLPFVIKWRERGSFSSSDLFSRDLYLAIPPASEVRKVKKRPPAPPKKKSPKHCLRALKAKALWLPEASSLLLHRVCASSLS